MAADVFPILFRPPSWMAPAMQDAADEDGCSRNEWMTGVLQAALEARGVLPPPDDAGNVADQPLPIEVG